MHMYIGGDATSHGKLQVLLAPRKQRGSARKSAPPHTNQGPQKSPEASKCGDSSLYQKEKPPLPALVYSGIRPVIPSPRQDCHFVTLLAGLDKSRLPLLGAKIQSQATRSSTTRAEPRLRLYMRHGGYGIDNHHIDPHEDIHNYTLQTTIYTLVHIRLFRRKARTRLAWTLTARKLPHGTNPRNVVIDFSYKSLTQQFNNCPLQGTLPDIKHGIG